MLRSSHGEAKGLKIVGTQKNHGLAKGQRSPSLICMVVWYICVSTYVSICHRWCIYVYLPRWWVYMPYKVTFYLPFLFIYSCFFFWKGTREGEMGGYLKSLTTTEGEWFGRWADFFSDVLRGIVYLFNDILTLVTTMWPMTDNVFFSLRMPDAFAREMESYGLFCDLSVLGIKWFPNFRWSCIYYLVSMHPTDCAFKVESQQRLSKASCMYILCI